MSGAVGGTVLGLVAGLGLVLVLLSATSPRRTRVPERPLVARRLDDLLARAGAPGLGAGRVVGSCAVCGVLVALVVAGTSRSGVLALAFGLGGAYLPLALLRRRAASRRSELREVWPDVVDNLASAIRAGLALPDAVAQLGANGPPAVAPAFARFAVDYRASGRFGDALDALKDRLADPVADRIVESLRLAREVGGSELGRLLRDLSSYLREDARTRAELETRQGWTVNGARLAAAAPWVTLVLLSIRPEAVRAYDTPAGVLVLAVGAAVTFVAFRVMLRIGRLPDESRVLR